MQNHVSDLDDVRIFTEVARAGSFTLASRRLKMPKSTVSRRVAELEDRLGVLLLQRTTRKLHLTHAGETYFARTTRLMEEFEDAERSLAELQGEPRGVLKVTTPSDMNSALSQLITAFQDRYPQVDLVLLPTGRRVDLVGEGYDLALRAGTTLEQSMIARKLHESFLIVVASPDYLKKAGVPRAPEELSQHRCLIFSGERVEDTWDLEGPEGAISIPVRGRMAARDFGLLRTAALNGEGIAFLPVLSAARDLRTGTLVRLFENHRSKAGHLWAVYPSPRHLSPKVRVFIDFALEWFGSHCSMAAVCPGGARKEP